jgi:hypothetical protein
MSYLSNNTRERAPGPTMAFRVSAALLAGAAILLFCLAWSEAGLASAAPWLAALLAAFAAFMLAEAIIATIMIVIPPVLAIAVLVQFLAY